MSTLYNIVVKNWQSEIVSKGTKYSVTWLTSSKGNDEATRKEFSRVLAMRPNLHVDGTAVVSESVMRSDITVNVDGWTLTKILGGSIYAGDSLFSVVTVAKAQNSASTVAKIVDFLNPLSGTAFKTGKAAGTAASNAVEDTIKGAVPKAPDASQFMKDVIVPLGIVAILAFFASKLIAKEIA